MWAKGVSRNTADALGVKHNGRSLSVDVALVDFGSDHSFEEAAAIFARHYKFSISASTVRRVTEATGREVDQFIQNRLFAYEFTDDSRAFDSTANIAPSPKIFSLGFDGCMIRTGTLRPVQQFLDDGTECQLRTPTGRVKKQRSEEWKDVRTGYVKDDKKDQKKLFIGGKADYPTLTKDLFNLALGLGMDEYTKVVATCDGGQGLYEALDERFPDLQFILDFYHFREHLYATAVEMNLHGDVKSEWVNEKCNLAWEGKVTQLIGDLEKEYERTQVERIRRLLSYIERFKNSIHYGSYKEKGYAIGSGESESAHKYLTQKRLKLPGTWWSPENVNPMLSLRVLKQNEWWDDFWDDSYKLAA